MRRKIHLDFHTAAYVDGVGSRTDPKAFSRTLDEARVTDIVLFAKDCYGLCYFPTRVGTVHPGLARPNLLGDLVAAVTARGIRVQAYFTLGLDAPAAVAHPEWRQRYADGHYMTWGPSMALMDFTSRYVEEMVEPQLEEMLNAVPGICGVWFDICLYFNGTYYSDAFDQYCADHGVPGADMPTRRRLALQRIADVADALNARIARHIPNAENYYNTLVTLGGGDRSHLNGANEVEAPPFFVDTDDMSTALRYLRTLPEPVFGLTSRFQYPWQDIGALRSHDQLLFDAASVVSAGGEVSIGDHGHPHGVLEPLVYQRIGDVYRYLEALNPWIDGMRPLTEAAVLTTWEEPAERTASYAPPSAKCALRMLGELGIQADLIGPDSALDGYRLLVLPGDTPVAPDLADRLRAFVAGGGKLVATGEAWRGLEDVFGLDTVVPGTQPVLDEHWGEYVRPTPQLQQEAWAQVSYERLNIVTLQPGALALAERVPGLFTDRAPDHLGKTPPAPGDTADGTVIARYGDAVYSGLPIFANFQAHGNAIFRDIFDAILQQVYPARLLRHDGGPNVEAALHAGLRGYTLHLVQWASERWPVRHMYPATAPKLAPLTVHLRIPQQPAAVLALPEETPLPFHYGDGMLSFDTPPFRVHQAIGLVTERESRS